MLVAALVLGLGVGLLIGSLGGGGSVVTVPLLVYLLGLSAQEATSASLVIVGVTSAVAALQHARRGSTRWRIALLVGAAGIPSSVLGTALNKRIDGNVLLLAFAVLMVTAAIGLLWHHPEADEERSGPSVWVRLGLAGLGIGFLTGLLGVGGGFIIVPVLVIVLGLPMPAAVGTSLVIISLNALVSLAARQGHGSFDWSVIAPFTVTAVAGALVGERLSNRIPARTLSRAFAVLLLLVAAYVAVRAGTALA